MEHSELMRRRALLEQLGRDFRPGDGDGAVPSHFDLSTRAGTDLYDSLSDEELLTALRQAAVRLGHSPAQKELFGPWRAFIKARFGRWPLALEKAGLSRSAGAGGVPLADMNAQYERRQALLAQVRRAAAELGRMPHPTDLPEVCLGLSRAYATWNEVLSAAGVAREQAVYPIHELDGESRALLDGLRTQARALGRAPLRSEVDEHVRAVLKASCGSWRNALYQVGLEPVIHITPFSSARLDRPEDAPVKRHGTALHDCYYRVLDPGEKTRADLTEVAELGRTLGHPPKRGEVSAELRRRLQSACGSWSNALFQLSFL